MLIALQYRLEDHAVYYVGGQRRHAAEMVSKGYAFKSLNVTEDGSAFSAVFEPAAGTGTSQAMYNMTVKSYHHEGVGKRAKKETG